MNQILLGDLKWKWLAIGFVNIVVKSLGRILVFIVERRVETDHGMESRNTRMFLRKKNVN